MPVCMFRENKCRYEIQEKFPVWYTGIYRPISSNNRMHKNKLKQQLRKQNPNAFRNLYILQTGVHMPTFVST
jgi:hypothetical protein